MDKLLTLSGCLMHKFRTLYKAKNASHSLIFYCSEHRAGNKPVQMVTVACLQISYTNT